MTGGLVQGGIIAKEQEIRSNCRRHNTTKTRQCIFINNAVVGAIPVASRVNNGIARQQQLDDFNMTKAGGLVQGAGTAEGTGNQEQMS